MDDALLELQHKISECLSEILTEIDSMDIDTDNVSIDVNISIKESNTDNVANITVSI